MVQSPSWEANWFAASQEIPHISRNPKVHYRTHKRPPPVSILGQHNPVHIPTSHLLEIHPNIIHPSMPRSPQWSLSLRYGPENRRFDSLYAAGCFYLLRNSSVRIWGPSFYWKGTSGPYFGGGGGGGGWGGGLKIHLLLVPKLRMCGAITPTPLCVSKMWRRINFFS